MVVLNNLEALDQSLRPQKTADHHSRKLCGCKSACIAPPSEPICGSLWSPWTEVESLMPEVEGSSPPTLLTSQRETLSPSTLLFALALPDWALGLHYHPPGNQGLTSYLRLFPRRGMDEGTPSPLHPHLSLPQKKCYLNLPNRTEYTGLTSPPILVPT